MRALGLAIATCALATDARAADDGAIEVNAVRAAAGGINGSVISDPPGFPVLITQPGGYRLTSNLDGGGTTNELIRVSASDVTLDLNGFVLSNAREGVASLSGFANNVTVRGGSIRGMAENGTNLNGRGTRIEALRAIGNGRDGIGVHGDGALVLDCLATGNARFGVLIGRGAIRGTVVAANLQGGLVFTTTPASLVVTSSVSLGNGSQTVSAPGAFVANAALTDNLIVGNSGRGLESFGGSSGFARNVISGNGGFALFGTVVPTGPNACNGAAC